MTISPDIPKTRNPDNLKVVFFGTPRFAQIVLEKLIDSPFRPQLVVTAPDARVGRGLKLVPSPVKRTAIEKGIEVSQPKTFDFRLSTFDSFDMAILVAYGKLIPKRLLSIPKYGFINVHPSLLPKYRGPSPIQSAILAGEKKSGVSLMLLDEQLDHGPILAKQQISIDKNDTHATLAEKLASLGAQLLLESLPAYSEGSLKPKPQDHKQATFTKHIKKEDGYIDPENPPAQEVLHRMIRAYFPWPTVWTKLRTQNSGLKTIKFLPGNLILPEGKRPMSIKEFKNGYPEVFQKLAHLFEDKTQP